MPLKEIKNRIGSVKGTLKITSAMKLVASAKLHKAQQAVSGMLPYQQALYRMLSTVSSGVSPTLSYRPSESLSYRPSEARGEIFPSRVALIAVSSNSSLCGGFNANVVRKVLETLTEYREAGIPEENVTVIPIGRKMADAMRRVGLLRHSGLDPESLTGLSHLIDHPSFSSAAAFAGDMIERFRNGDFDRVELIYNHFVSTASQVPTREVWLPFAAEGKGIPSPAPQVRNDREVLVRSDKEALGGNDRGKVQVCSDRETLGGNDRQELVRSDREEDRLWIFEPSREALLEELLPKLMRLKIYSMLLDSAAAEHAARTVAMQTATDNGEDILEELTLEYNKGRQQKITSELLDIIGGSMQQ